MWNQTQDKISYDTCTGTQTYSNQHSELRVARRNRWEVSGNRFSETFYDHDFRFVGQKCPPRNILFLLTVPRKEFLIRPL